MYNCNCQNILGKSIYIFVEFGVEVILLAHIPQLCWTNISAALCTVCCKKYTNSYSVQILF